MINFGEVPAGAVLPILFASYSGATGASITLTGLAVTDIEVYKGTSMTQRASDAGYVLMDTDGIDLDGITGIHGFSVDTGDNTDASFYSVGSYFTVVVSAVTIDGQTVNFIAATFRLKAAESVAGYPKADTSHFGGTAGTFSAGRPEVNATHAAGTAWNSGAIGAGTLASDTITAAKIAADAITAAKIADGAIDAATFAAGAINAAAIAADAIGASELAADAVAEIADAVWDEVLSGHAGVGSAGAALSDAGGSGDPWSTALPGAYGAGTAGQIVGDYINVAVSSRGSAADLATVAGYLDTEIAAIKAKTDNLPAAPAATGDIPSAATIADAVWDEATSGHVSAGSTGLALGNTDLRGSRTVVRGTVSSTSPSTTQFTPSALSPAGVAADQFKGRIIVFDNDTTTTALRGQATDITANTAAGLPVFTYTALTTAPQSGDSFSIV